MAVEIHDGFGNVYEQSKPTDETRLNKCMDLTVKLWNMFKSIESKHPMDEQETCRDIHDIQNRLFSIAHKQGIKIENQR